jgi:Big-like domain-containing protein
MRRLILAVAVMAVALAAALLGVAGGGPAAAANACSAPPSPEGGVEFVYTGTVQQVRVPPGVVAIRVDATGGHGGQFERTGAGGAGGRVVTSLPVVGGECLNVYVGGFGGGHGGFGWGTGGNHGETLFPTSYDGAGGGGATAITRGAPEEDDTPLMIAGGGGGGGGDGLGDYEGGEGGAGATAEGPDTPRGVDGSSPTMLPEPGSQENLGGEGGWGGDGFDGGAGESEYTHPNLGAGGGGGSGWKGGDGGSHWVGTGGHEGEGGESEGGERELLKAAGGGGGGGGSSYVVSGATDTRYLVSESDCPVGGGSGCNGEVAISWVERPAKVAAYAGNAQSTVITSRYPTPLQAKVTALSGDPVPGVAVRFSLPSSAAGAYFDDGGQGTVATAVSDSRGVATSPPLIANRAAGPWTAEATAEKVAEPALFSLANQPAPTATAIYASVNPSVAGQPLTLTAEVGASPSTVGIPTGRVQFRLDGDDVGGSVPLSASGTATVPSPQATLGAHRVEAVFDGGRDFVSSRGTVTTRVERGRAAVALASSENPSSLGDPVKFTATVSAAAPAQGTPTGAVQFLIDGVAFGQPVPLQNGSATSLPPSASQLPEGRHVVEAAYTGDASFEPAGGTIEQAVGPQATATVVTSSPPATVFGQPVTFTATVTSPEGQDPAGAVDFQIGGEPIGCDDVTLDGSQAQCVPAEPLEPGAHTVTAEYRPGSVDFEPSRGRMAQSVGSGDATVAVEAVPSPSVFGVTYALHAEVEPQAPAAGVPTGSVSFLVDGVALGEPVALDDQGATLSGLRSLGAGPHVIEAIYSGDGRFGATRGESTTVVDRAVTAATVSSSAAPGGAVVFDAALEVLAPGAGQPGGSVTFVVDGEPRGAPVPIAGGRARSAPVGDLGAGPHDVRVRYSGTADFAPSDATMIQPGTEPSRDGEGSRATGDGTLPIQRSSRPAAPPLLCGRPIVLSGGQATQGRTHLSGVARPDLVGRRVTLFLGNERVGRATVRPDGSFDAAVPTANGPRAIYRASVAASGSAPVRLSPRTVRVVAEHTTRHGVRVTFAAPPHQRLMVAQMLGCLRNQTKSPRTLHTDDAGLASITLARPPAGDWSRTYVAWTSQGTKKPAAFSLPVIVAAARR